MINRFGVENFKAFKNKIDLELAPITLLTGTNSSGKSSFTQSFRILQSSLSLKDFPSLFKHNSLLLKYENSILGDFDSIRHNQKLPIVFNLPVKFPGISKKLNLELKFIRFDVENFNITNLLDSLKIFYDNREIYSFSHHGSLTTLIDGEEYEGGSPEVIIDFNFFLDEFTSILKTAKQVKNSGKRLLDYGKLQGDKGIISKSEFQLRKYFANKPLTDDLKRDLEVWLKHKEYYVNASDYQSDSNGEQYYFSPNIINDLILINSDYTETYKIRSDESNYNILKKYEFNKPILDYEYSAKKLSINELQKISTIELDFLNQYNFNPSQAYNFDLFDNDLLTYNIAGWDDKTFDTLKTNICKELQLSSDKLTIKIGENYKLFIKYYLKNGFQYILEKLDKSFFKEKVEYIPSVRSIPNRYFSSNRTDTYFSKLIMNLKSVDSKRMSLLNEWIRKFDIAEKLKLKTFGDTGVSQVYLIKDGVEINLMDTGHGVSQVLPILIACIFYRNKFFIIEEPETNLHPALQSKLAEFFVEMQKHSDSKIIIETHSEYLIRKMQLLVNQKKVHHDNVIIHYFHPPKKIPKGEKQVKTIRFEENGILDGEFGKGFTDEANNAAIHLYQLTKERNN